MSDPEGSCPWLSPAEAKSAVHFAQIRYAEPLLESGRLEIIRRNRERILPILPMDDEYTKESGYNYTEPEELELRHLIFKRAAIGFYQADLDLVNFLHKIRNDLSHLHYVSYERMKELTKKAEDGWR